MNLNYLKTATAKIILNDNIYIYIPTLAIRIRFPLAAQDNWILENIVTQRLSTHSDMKSSIIIIYYLMKSTEELSQRYCVVFSPQFFIYSQSPFQFCIYVMLKFELILQIKNKKVWFFQLSGRLQVKTIKKHYLFTLLFCPWLYTSCF